MSDLISVIVPVYDVDKWLDECVESIVNQTHKNLEIILVDDGSPDRCPQICDEWAKRDSRIRVIHKENGGLSTARNAGLDICTGDYIGFVDSDDFIESNMYEILYREIKEKNVDAVRYAMCRYREGNIYHVQHIDKEKYYNRENLLDCYFYHKEDICGGVCDKLFCADLFSDVRFPEGVNSEDYYVNVKLYSKINKMYYNNNPLYYYRLRDESITRKKKVDEHALDKIIISDMVGEYVSKNIPERKNDAIAFRAIARFSVYYEAMKKIHDKKMEHEWKKDLRRYNKNVLTNNKFGSAFKIKYLWFGFLTNSYMLVKKIVDKDM